jgi:hypothetical protein
MEQSARRRARLGVVNEDVARACASSSLIPAGNKFGTVPLLLSGSKELYASTCPGPLWTVELPPIT